LAARGSSTEEDLKIHVQRLIDDALEELGVSQQVRYEKRVYQSRRADALYPAVVLEYKRPRALENREVKAKAIDELVDYLKGMSGGQVLSRKFVGIALDGTRIMFVRARLTSQQEPPRQQATLDGKSLALQIKPEVIGPVDIDADSIEQLLLYLRQLTRKTLSPEALAEGFGPSSELGRRAIVEIWKAVTQSKNPKVLILFAEWDRIFGIVYGEALEKAHKDSSELSSLYGLPKEAELKQSLFAIHTYFALLMKLVAAEILALQFRGLLTSFARGWSVAPDDRLQTELSDLETGRLFKRFGITNFLEGDFFAWYLEEWDSEFASLLRDIARELSDYEPATAKLEVDEVTDLLKRLYQYMVPKSLRHDLGEYYTPDWLANQLLDDVGYEGDPDKRILDPACGSGTFLVLALRRVSNYFRSFPERYGPESIQKILANVVGFDINPLAVLAARTNYLMALTPLRTDSTEDIEIPVYLADSVLTPRTYSTALGPNIRTIRTAADTFYIDEALSEKGIIDRILTLLDEVLPSGTAEVFIERVRSVVNLDGRTAENLKTLFERFKILEKQGKDRIWTHIIKNNFAPLYAGQFHYVVGNPPWIRWGFLSQDYRDATLQLWQNYGLFSLKGMQARLGGGEKDFSMLFLYAAADSYLGTEGVIGFLITQEVVRAKGAGEGFRRFRIGSDGPPLKVLLAEDLVSVKPFEDASNKTFMLILRKGEETKYPIRYRMWHKNKGVGKIPHDYSLETVKQLVKVQEMTAVPLANPTDPWLTLAKGGAAKVSNLRGRAEYKAFTGAAVDPYGVYLLAQVGPEGERNLMFENLPELGKQANLPKVKQLMERDLVFPVVRGKDVQRWDAEPRLTALIVQDPDTRTGFGENWMMKTLPRTYAYLNDFRSALLKKEKFWKYYSKTVMTSKKLTSTEEAKLGKYTRYNGVRRGKHVYQVTSSPFYTMFNVITETMSPWKVVWPMGASDMRAAVVSSKQVGGQLKPVIPATGTMTYVPLEQEDEAHFLCAVLNSKSVGEYIGSFSSAGRGFGAPSILTHVRIPRFNPDNHLHLRLSNLSKSAHSKAKANLTTDVQSIENQVDIAVKELFFQNR